MAYLHWGNAHDDGRSLVVDNWGNVFFTGSCEQTWGAPVRSHSGMGVPTTMVVMLDTSGNYQWHTFFGGSINWGTGIGRDSGGNLYIVGTTDGSWDYPIRSCTINYDAYVAKVEWDGDLVWNTCLGVNDNLTWDAGYGIATSSLGESYVVGYSKGRWGSPLYPYVADSDGFLAKLGPNGSLEWNALFGTPGDEYCYAVALNDDDSVFVAGQAFEMFGDFGEPRSPTYGKDGFILEMIDADSKSGDTQTCFPVKSMNGRTTIICM